MTKTGKRLAAVFLAVAMAVTFMPIMSTQTVYADTEYSIIPYCEGLQDGKAVIGQTLSFNPETVISSNDEMLEAFFAFGDPLIFSHDDDPEGQSFRHQFTVDDDGFCRFSLDNSIGCAGKSFRISFRFGNGSDNTKYFTSDSIYTVASIESVPVSGLVTKTYTGKPLTQDLGKLEMGETILTEGADYQVKYKNNINAGTAIVLIEGTGNFVGSISTAFTIKKAANPLTMKARTATVKYSKLKKKAQTLAVTRVINFTKDAKDKKTYTLSSARKGKKSFKKYFTINKSTGKVTVKKGLKKGAYRVKVKVRAAGNANYLASAGKAVTFTVKVK